MMGQHAQESTLIPKKNYTAAKELWSSLVNDFPEYVEFKKI